ncbi:16S rRNA (uracil(1498)-N(3))-methyltransferase [Peribacillus simplex]|uniref:Ribosomal RNA small subunit methyltransferase E n=2 Tax=Peribacillus TaxID=2675229 RepID=A0AA90T4D0_9BACI|nr:MULTISPECIES: 16S rRNA (uracil(1498)-N(3))-methyltransferase [Peribacillus]MDP1420791.1 16S rRNA (uracil(1498)-N(3))-methyltransferase [Peribacillus simplex]MDP1453568.1 16S rRNA (uracil(1498)-N(3))-methyltransferase [Peribacillus frigoritolerans]
MQRYFLNEVDINGNTVTISGDDFHHIARVMRMGPGERIITVKGNGMTAIAEISEITDDAVIGTVTEWKNEEKELPVRVVIASGLPKGDKLEYIVQKGTELGAVEFIPFIAARSVVKWDHKKVGKKLERLQKISKEAAEQSHRTVIPAIKDPMTADQLAGYASGFDHKLIAFEEEAKRGETSVLASVLKDITAGQSILFVFGPEGGLADKEIEKLTDAGFMACGLGPRILRTETAPLYALSAVSYHVELLR